jgi:hypothetical protein
LDTFPHKIGFRDNKNKAQDPPMNFMGKNHEKPMVSGDLPSNPAASFNHLPDEEDRIPSGKG